MKAFLFLIMFLFVFCSKKEETPTIISPKLKFENSDIDFRFFCSEKDDGSDYFRYYSPLKKINPWHVVLSCDHSSKDGRIFFEIRSDEEPDGGQYPLFFSPDSLECINNVCTFFQEVTPYEKEKHMENRVLVLKVINKNILKLIKSTLVQDLWVPDGEEIENEKTRQIEADTDYRKAPKYFDPKVEHYFYKLPIPCSECEHCIVKVDVVGDNGVTCEKSEVPIPPPEKSEEQKKEEELNQRIQGNYTILSNETIARKSRFSAAMAVGKFNKGDTVYVVGVSNSFERYPEYKEYYRWAEVRLKDGKTGWIYGADIDWGEFRNEAVRSY